jgi:hypothetical protein
LMLGQIETWAFSSTLPQKKIMRFRGRKGRQ